MRLTRKKCRCCGSLAFVRKRSIRVSPFFAKFGLQFDLFNGFPREYSYVTKLDRSKRASSFFLDMLPPASRFLNRFLRSFLLIPYGYCESCEFLAPWFEISNDQLLDFYTFYLSEDYKAKRLLMEKAYISAVQSHGSKEEFFIRQQEYEKFIEEDVIQLLNRFEVSKLKLLDYGGGESGIQPNKSLVETRTLEVSDESDPETFHDFEQFHLVQSLHVLEHVGNPLATTKHMLELCIAEGLVFIEVPLEYPGWIQDKEPVLPDYCNEHINKFTEKSIRKLAENLNTEIIRIGSYTINTLHRDQLTVIRLLMRKSR